MRTLKFIIDGQIIKPDPSCDFAKMVPGTKGYLQAHFTFDKNWVGCEKMAVFIGQGTREQLPVRIVNNICTIPPDVLFKRSYRVYVIGVRPGLRIVTNKLEVKQDG